MQNRQIIGTSFDINKYLFHDIKLYINYVKDVINKEELKILYIGFANNDSLLERIFFKYYIKIMFPKWQVYILTTNDIVNNKNLNSVFDSDFIFVGGGKTSLLLDVFQNNNFINILKQAYTNGCILGGTSAGLLCWFTEGITDSFIKLQQIKCLGILNYSCTVTK